MIIKISDNNDNINKNNTNDYLTVTANFTTITTVNSTANLFSVLPGNKHSVSQAPQHHSSPGAP